MSMLSAQCYELRKCADALQDAIDSLSLGRVTYDGLTDALHYGINDLRSAANVIWELRNKMSDMVDQKLEVDRLKAKTAKMRAERDEWHRVAVSKQDIIDHMRDARAENAKLREYVTAVANDTYATEMFDCGGCRFFAQCYNDEPKEHKGPGCQWRLWARELGIEVDE